MEMNPCLLLDDPSQLLQSDNAEKENNAEKEKILSPACPSASLDVNEEPERHTINPLLSPTKSTRLTMGSRVIILGTDNVEQRVPQYVGVEAEIVVVPGKLHVSQLIVPFFYITHWHLFLNHMQFTRRRGLKLNLTMEKLLLFARLPCAWCPMEPRWTQTTPHPSRRLSHRVDLVPIH